MAQYLYGDDITGKQTPEDFFKKPVANNPRLKYAYSKDMQTKQVKGFQGSPALVNPYALFRYAPAEGAHNVLYDIEGQEGVTPTESRNPTQLSIIEWSKDKKSTPYFLSDFLYCKYDGKIPNNYMVTLRRFPMPTLDNLTNPRNVEFPPAAQAVTWCSTETDNSLGELLSFKAGLRWDEMEADVQKIEGNEQNLSDSPFGGGTFIKNVARLTSKYRRADVQKRAQLNSDYWYDADDDQLYLNGLYGPINVVDKTFRRKRGLDFDQEFKLNFHYNLKSYNNINPKMALIDMMCNLLALTYNSGQFWGGSIRYFPQYPEVPWLGDQDKFYSGDFKGFFSSVVSDVTDAAGNLGGYLNKLFSDPISALKDLAADFGADYLGKKAAQNHPGMLGIKSLLTGNPVGEWHLVIGNPLNPIAMIGNLVCMGADFKFSDKLGADDFPEEMIVTVTLKHGKPRDKADIESMFNLGEGRIYYSPPMGNEQIKGKQQPTNSNDEKHELRGFFANGTEKDFDDYVDQTKTVANKSERLASYSLAEIRAALGVSTGS